MAERREIERMIREIYRMNREMLDILHTYFAMTGARFRTIDRAEVPPFGEIKLVYRLTPEYGRLYTIYFTGNVPIDEKMVTLSDFEVTSYAERKTARRAFEAYKKPENLIGALLRRMREEGII